MGSIDSAFDYEVDQTTHYMYLTITDGENSANEVIYFEVRDVNDAPEFASNAIFSIDENQIMALEVLPLQIKTEIVLLTQSDKEAFIGLHLL